MRSDVNEFSVTGRWDGGFEEQGLQAWAEGLRGRLAAPKANLGLVFMSPRFFPHASQVLEILQVHARLPLLVGCSSSSLIQDAFEIEDAAGVVAGLYHLPGAELRAFHFTPAQAEAAEDPEYWPQQTGLSGEGTNGWLVLVDPFHLDSERWLQGWNRAYARAPILGGLASGNHAEQQTQVYLNGAVHEDGGVAVSFGGAVRLAGVVSQGCTPIGEPWTITRAEGNFIHEIGNRPAYQVLVDTFNSLPPEQQQRAQGNLFVGLVINEYQDDFRRGDFLIRNLLGVDPVSGVLVVGARPRAGQSLQFQCRDAAAATEDMVALMGEARRVVGEARVYGGCLCSCSGRGRRLFGEPNHDAALAQKHFGPLGLTGFFCNGEIGPVGDRTFVHGYSAALAFFVEK